MDICYEYMVRKKNTPLDIIKIVLALSVATVLTSAIILLFFMGENLLGFNLLIILFLWWGAIWVIKSTRVEYEYTITNHEMDIDVIRGKSRRKRMTTIDLKKIEYFGNINDEKTKENMKNAGSISKEYYFVGDRESENIYVTDVISRKDATKVRVYIEPNEKLLEYIRIANPKAVSVPEGEKE